MIRRSRTGSNGIRPRSGDALIVVDLQRDFLPTGALPVPASDLLPPVINEYINEFQNCQLPVVATRDWHPVEHCSFQKNGGEWPVHCVRDTKGAEFAGLELPADGLIVSKGTECERDAYSGFSGTNLEKILRDRGVRRVYICGVATEFCVFETARDALAAGFEVILLTGGIRAIDSDKGRQKIDELVALGMTLHDPVDRGVTSTVSPALFTDLYQLTMLQAYFDQGMEETAVFEFFVRKLPQGRNFLMAAGLEQALDYLEDLRFTTDELEWLAADGRFRQDFIDCLERLRFSGDVHAMPEGTIFFPHEPILRVTAPLPQAQLVESRLINILQFQTLIAAKAARCVLAAPDKLLVDFGMRRAHGAEAGLLAARAAYIAGFTGTATVSAGQLFGVPVFGTMAHSFIQAHDDEMVAFEKFAKANRDNVVLLLDTYDTEAAAVKAVELASRLNAHGIKIKGVRLDSGDLAQHARHVRHILDDGGLTDTTIFASGSLDEFKLDELLSSDAPIDGFGIGSRLDVSADAPYLDCAYKLQEYAGRPRRKRSEGKATWPGRKQVYRAYESGRLAGDVVTREDDPQPGEPLLRQVMRAGRRVQPARPLQEIRQHAAANLAHLPTQLSQLDGGAAYAVEISQSLRELADSIDQAACGKIL